MPRLISGEEMVRAMGLFWVSQHCSECCTHFPRPLLDVLANCMLPIIACNDILSPMDGVEKAPSTTTRCTMKRPTAAVPASTSHESPNWFLLRNSKWKYAFSMQKKHNSLKYGSFCFFWSFWVKIGWLHQVWVTGPNNQKEMVAVDEETTAPVDR